MDKSKTEESTCIICGKEIAGRYTVSKEIFCSIYFAMWNEDNDGRCLNCYLSQREYFSTSKIWSNKNRLKTEKGVEVWAIQE